MSTASSAEMPTPVVVAWSGGKDSSLALSTLLADPAVSVRALVTAITSEYDRISIHGVRRELLERQAAAIGLPLVIAPLVAGAPNAQYEAAWAQALTSCAERFDGVRSIAYGDLFLEDVRAFREAQMKTLGWQAVYPLWGKDTAQLAEKFIADGYKAVLTCVDTTQLDASFAGRTFDRILLHDFPASVDPCGERGEFHTFVWDGPHMSAPVPIAVGEKLLRDDRFQYCDFLPR